MSVLNNARSPVYHHFVLLVWEEPDSAGRHVTWPFSLQYIEKDARIGFKSINELKVFVVGWMKKSIVNISPKEN